MRLRFTARGAVRNPDGLLHRLWHGETGVSTVELAFLAPILAGLMIAVIDYGTAWTRQMTLANAVRAGTQYAMVRRPVEGDVTLIEQAVIDSAPSAPASPLTRTLQVALVCACSGNAPGSVDCETGDCTPVNMEHYITINLQEDYEMLFDWPFINNPVPLQSQAVLRLD